MELFFSKSTDCLGILIILYLYSDKTFITFLAIKLFEPINNPFIQIFVQMLNV